MFTPLLIAALGARELVPILAAVGIGCLVLVVYAVINRGDDRTDRRLDRIGKLGGPGEGMSSTATGSEKFQELLERAAPALAKPLTGTEQEQSDLKIKLANGGWRSENAVSVFLGVKFAFLLAGLVLAGTLVVPSYGMTRDGIMYSFLIAGVMFYLPSIFVWWRVRQRKEQIFFGLPDALDLMVVCVESGLGLDAALRKVCEEMGTTYPIISEEFSIGNFQLQMGRPRREVLHDLGVRTGVDDMKSLAAILIQADRFGSSIAQALRVQSDSMRVRRKQQAEERAAKTAVQLIFPLVLFIFPAIFIVLVGPAAIQIMETLGSMK